MSILVQSSKVTNPPNKMEAIRLIRNSRGLLHELDALDLEVSTYAQRVMILGGYVKAMDERLDELEDIIKNHLENKGDSQSAIECLEKDIDRLEKELLKYKKPCKDYDDMLDSLSLSMKTFDTWMHPKCIFGGFEFIDP